MAGVNDIDLLVDQQGLPVGLEQSSEDIGLGSPAAVRMIQALAFNENETGPSLINGGEFLCDNSGIIVADPNMFILGFAKVWVSRLV